MCNICPFDMQEQIVWPRLSPEYKTRMPRRAGVKSSDCLVTLASTRFLTYHIQTSCILTWRKPMFVGLTECRTSDGLDSDGCLVRRGHGPR